MKLESKTYKSLDYGTTLIHKDPSKALELREDKQYVYVHTLNCGNLTYLLFADIDDIKIALSSARDSLNRDYIIPSYACESTKRFSLKGMNILNDITDREYGLFSLEDEFLLALGMKGRLINPNLILRDATRGVKDGYYKREVAFELTQHILSDDSKMQKKLDLLKLDTKHLRIKYGLLHADNISDISGVYKKANVINYLNCSNALCEIPNGSVVMTGMAMNCTVACNARRQSGVKYVRSKVYLNKPCILSRAAFTSCEIIVNAPVVFNEAIFKDCTMRVHDACSISSFGFKTDFKINVKID